MMFNTLPGIVEGDQMSSKKLNKIKASMSTSTVFLKSRKDVWETLQKLNLNFYSEIDGDGCQDRTR